MKVKNSSVKVGLHPKSHVWEWDVYPKLPYDLFIRYVLVVNEPMIQNKISLSPFTIRTASLFPLATEG